MIQNSALLLAMMSIVDLLTSKKSVERRWLSKVLAGVLLGLLCIALMTSAFELEKGIIFDTRSVLLSLSGLFLGWFPTFLAMIISSVFRFWQGGVGSLAGVIVIFVSGGIGVLWRQFRKGQLSKISVLELFGFGVVVHLAMIIFLVLTLPNESGMKVLKGVSLNVIIVFPLATIALGWIAVHRFQREDSVVALALSEEKHRILFETMSTGVIYQSADGIITSANPAAEKILHLPLERMKGKSSMDTRWKMIREDGTLVPGSEHPAMITLKTGEKFGPVIRGIHIPEIDDYVWISIHTIPLFRQGEEKAFQVYSTFEDITENKKMQDELVSILAEKEKLIHELSHRSYNNMQTIEAMLLFKLSTHPELSLEQFVQEINEQIQSMATAYRVLQNSESLSKIDMKGYLQSLIGAIVEKRKKEYRLQLHFDLQEIPILLDVAVPLGTVINELVVNCIRHAFPRNRNSQEEPMIAISLRISKDCEIEITISDNGVGWEPHRGNDPNSITKGGIGLVVSLVERQLGGSITFKKNKGTIVSINFKDNRYSERV